MKDWTYTTATKNAANLVALKMTDIHLNDLTDVPWQLATSCKSGGMYRLNTYIDVKFKGKDPKTGLTFTWYLDLEKYESNGKTSFTPDIDKIQYALEHLSGSGLTQFITHLSIFYNAITDRIIEAQNFVDAQKLEIAPLNELIKIYKALLSDVKASSDGNWLNK
jgi:hypothetical protein